MHCEFVHYSHVFGDAIWLLVGTTFYSSITMGYTMIRTISLAFEWVED